MSSIRRAIACSSQAAATAASSPGRGAVISAEIFKLPKLVEMELEQQLPLPLPVPKIKKDVCQFWARRILLMCLPLLPASLPACCPLPCLVSLSTALWNQMNMNSTSHAESDCSCRSKLRRILPHSLFSLFYIYMFFWAFGTVLNEPVLEMVFSC